MTHEEIVADLKSRGEKNIQFREDGVIVTEHGKHTTNYWIVEGKELKCINCKPSF